LPSNDLSNDPIPRQLIFDVNPNEVSTFGIASPFRRDRKRGIPLACCATTTDNFNDYLTTVMVPKGVTPMLNVNSLFLGFYKGAGLDVTDGDVKGIRVFLGSSDNMDNMVEASGNLYRDNCRAPWVDLSSFWFDFADEHQNISNVHMCIESMHCDDNGESLAMLTGVVVY